MNIKDIQQWERDFTKRKGIAQDEEKAIKIAMLKLTEEVGEVSKAILEKDWDGVLAEVTDVIVFACKASSSVAVGFPYFMFSFILPEKSIVF